MIPLEHMSHLALERLPALQPNATRTSLITGLFAPDADFTVFLVNLIGTNPQSAVVSASGF